MKYMEWVRKHGHLAVPQEPLRPPLLTTMNDPLEIITDACNLCFKFGLRASASVTGNLRKSDEGFYYVPVDEVTAYHPLEAALHCEDVLSGDWKEDVATRLGVSAEWIEGFIAGFAQAGEKSTDQDYIQGYLTAEELRQRRPRLPMEEGS
jgi:hypothetical protein